MRKLSYHELEKELIALKSNQKECLRDIEYKIFYDNMADMVEIIELIYDKNKQPIDFYIRAINISFTRFVGKTKEQLINKKASVIFGEIEKHLLYSFANVDRTGKHINFKNYNAAFDKYHYISSWKVSKNRIGVSYTDISKAEKAEIEQQKFNKTILDNIPADIAVFDKDHTYLYVNPNGIKNVETRNWIIGKDDFDYCSLKNLDNTRAQDRRDLFNKAIETKQQIEWIDKLNKEGKYSYIMRRFYPIFINNIFHYVIGYGVDISELKKTQYQLHLLNSNLEEKIRERTTELIKSENKLKISLRTEIKLNKLKSKFISTTSHEFRTPLSAINFAAGFIKKYWTKMSPAIMEQKINRVEEQVAHMVVLLDDVLLVGKGDAGEIKNNPTHINFGNFIYEIMEEVYYSCQKSHEIELIDPRELKNSAILIDEKLGRNIFINLLSNAIKFSPNAKKITIELSSEKEETIIVVTDFGIGIPKSELTNIFTPFIRGKNVDLIQGTGLGLSIVKAAVNAIGGKIIVTSIINNGSSFIVKLPKKYKSCTKQSFRGLL